MTHDGAMRIVVAGLGSAGRRHLRNLTALGVTDCILLRSGRATLPDEGLDGFPVVPDVDAALRLQPDAAVIATPSALHLDAAIPFARAGCHLLLEKPVSHTMANVDVLREAARAGGARVMVAFQYRHHPGLRAVREWVGGGAIGRVVSAHAHYGDHLPGWHPWEDYRTSYAARADLGGGAALTLCHPFDYLVWILGPVARVSGATGRQGGLGIDVEDTAVGLFEFQQGAVASVHVDMLQRPQVHTLQIIGTAGTIAWNQADGAARLWRVGAGQWEVRDAPPGFERNDMFLAEMRSFLDVVTAGHAPDPGLDTGAHVLAVTLAIGESARTGRRVTL